MTSRIPLDLACALEGCLLGTAAGDMVGLPFENLSRTHVARLLREPLEQTLAFGRGLVSDDTEHAVMLARSLIEERADAARFARRLAWRLRWWLLAAPPGVGGATARGILRLWLGVSPTRSGVRSAGNGPAMRAAPLGVLFGDDVPRLVAFVRASSALTHTDPRACGGALVVALAAACSRRLASASPDAALAALRTAVAEAQADEARCFEPLLADMQASLAAGVDVAGYARALGCEAGVTGFVMHTVPVALYAWLVHGGDFRRAVTEVVRCGGDTDSVAAITGAIVGAGSGADAIPASWLDRALELPGTMARIRRVARRLAQADASSHADAATWRTRALEGAWWPVQFARNVAMFALLLLVLVRRTTLALARR